MSIRQISKARSLINFTPALVRVRFGRQIIHGLLVHLSPEKSTHNLPFVEPRYIVYNALSD